MRTACLFLAGALATSVVVVDARQQNPPSVTGPTQPAPAPRRPADFAGTWTFDEKATHEDQKNWRRPVADETGTLTAARAPWNSGYLGAGPLMPGPGVPMGSAGPRSSAGIFDNDVRRAMRDLLELAETYTIAVGDGTITLTDDLDRETTFATDGRREKHHQGATDYDSVTTWNADGQLLQDLAWTKELKITQIWLPADDGQSLFVWMKVQKPTFTPPVKDIKRVYARAK